MVALDRPRLRLNPNQGRRLRAGTPWVYSNEIAMQPEYRQFPPGGLVAIEGDDGTRFGTFMFNPHSLIAARRLDRDPAAMIDADWLRGRLREAIALRERVCDTPFHRLVHAEGDRLPGLIVDRYDDVAVVQANSAGMDLLTPLLVEAMTALLPLRAVVARSDSPARRQEGLAENVTVFTAQHAKPTEAADLARRAFDTAAIAARYQDFLEKWGGRAPQASLPDDLARQLVLHGDWLDLVRQDPHLPAELLAEDWPAIEAEQLFQALATRYREIAAPLAAAAVESIDL